ncbi:MAG: hypothetical protein RLZZ303_268, partial [Candidatus Hydrogenedentota bacterium]
RLRERELRCCGESEKERQDRCGLHEDRKQADTMIVRFSEIQRVGVVRVRIVARIPCAGAGAR